MIKQPFNLLSYWGAYLQNKFPLLSLQLINNEIVIASEPQNISFILAFLRYHLNSRFEILTCITGSDYPEKKDRFEITYELLSLHYNIRLRLKTYLKEKTGIESICNVFCSASWWEREAYDLFGIFFLNHPDLRRILTDYGFEGFALRKDFPLSGFVEVRFNEKKKRVVCEPIELAQQFRHFTYESPWTKALN